MMRQCLDHLLYGIDATIRLQDDAVGVIEELWRLIERLLDCLPSLLPLGHVGFSDECTEP
jgi:hypothetical protein